MKVIAGQRLLERIRVGKELQGVEPGHCRYVGMGWRREGVDHLRVLLVFLSIVHSGMCFHVLTVV